MKYNPWKNLNARLGFGQAGTYVGSKTDASGITSKIVVDDAVVNEPLAPSKEMDNAVLVGGINVDVQMDADYTPTVESDNRLRTCCISIKTLVSPLKPGTYGQGAKLPNTNPESPKA